MKEITSPQDIKFETIELNNYRFKLPIGIPIGDKLIRDFSLKDITGRHEILLGKIQMDNFNPDDQKSIVPYVNKLIKKMFLEVVDDIDEIPLKDFCQINNITIQNIFDQMYLADAIVFFLNARIISYGRGIRISGRCPCPKAVEITPSEDDTHDLGSLKIFIYPDNSLPIYRYQLRNSVVYEKEEITYLDISPPRLNQLSSILNDEDNPLYIKLLKTVSEHPNILEIYSELNKQDRHNFKAIIEQINIFGPEKIIEMECYCGQTWNSPLLNGYNYESFFFTLLAIPRSQKDILQGTNPAQSMLDQIAFFLSTGEQAPFSNPESVYDLTVPSRNFWVSELSKTYEKQSEEMKKSQAKSKGRSRKR